MSVYDGKVVVLPFDADFGSLTVSADLMDRYRSETGRPAHFDTWDQLVGFAEHFEGRDLDGDGVPDRAPCNTYCNLEDHGVPL